MNIEVFEKVLSTLKVLAKKYNIFEKHYKLFNDFKLACIDIGDNRYKDFARSVGDLIIKIGYDKGWAKQSLMDFKNEGTLNIDSFAPENNLEYIMREFSKINFTEIILYANVQAMQGKIELADFYKFIMGIFDMIQQEIIMLSALFVTIEKIIHKKDDHIIQILKDNFVPKQFQILLTIKAMDETMTKSFIAYNNQVTKEAFEKTLNSISDKLDLKGGSK